jgi:hypothetical protein
MEGMPGEELPLVLMLEPLPPPGDAAAAASAAAPPGVA